MEENFINDNYEKYYEIEELIGKGQYGKVFKVKKIKTNEIRAIKIIEIDNNKDEFMKNINNELKNMKIFLMKIQLNYMNIIIIKIK